MSGAKPLPAPILDFGQRLFKFMKVCPLTERSVLLSGASCNAIRQGQRQNKTLRLVCWKWRGNPVFLFKISKWLIIHVVIWNKRDRFLMRCKQIFQKLVFRTPENTDILKFAIQLVESLFFRKVERLLLYYICVFCVTPSPLSICHYTLDLFCNYIHCLKLWWLKRWMWLSLTRISCPYSC